MSTTYYAVAVLGFEEKERMLFRNILKISEQRPLEFRAFTSSRDTRPHVVIVNADHAESLSKWHAYRSGLGTHVVSAIFLCRGQAPEGSRYVLNRPFLATRLFSLLERVVTEEHGYQPAAAFAQDDMLLLTDERVPRPVGESKPRLVPVAPPARTDVRTTALVCDDSLPVRIQMKGVLEKVVDEVDFAETGEDALELAAKKQYDIIFLDVILPGIDGYETCRRIRKDLRRDKTPILMLTSNSSPADRVKAKLAGCDTYLIKPVKQGLFDDVIREFLRIPAAA